ncbi:MAG: fibronectin type III domain-containing protein [Verrucomicrobia bacterium]|nr:fibronectin type III domain-containing protein [Verrucomicrobiota bacterium]
MGRIKKNIRGWSASQKIATGRQRLNALANNSNFPNASMWLPPFQSAQDDLSAAHGDVAVKRGEYRSAVTRAKAAEKRWDQEYGFLAARVELESRGNDAPMVGAGFKLRGVRTAAQLPAAPQGLHATIGDWPGRIDLSWDGMDNARSYVVEMSTEGPSGGWKQTRISARSSCTIKELASGTKYWFRVAAIGTAGQGPWSNPVQKMAP